MVSTIYAAVALFFLGTFVLWILLKIAPWSAPLSAMAGFGLFVLGAYTNNSRMMGFGAGLFAFSVIVFVAGGGMNGR